MARRGTAHGGRRHRWREQQRKGDEDGKEPVGAHDAVMRRSANKLNRGEDR
jgi:hypothetical protein